MADLVIQGIDEPLEARLRAQAAANNRSIEEEVRQILLSALPRDVTFEAPVNLADAIRARFAPLGGVDLDLDWLRKQPSERDPPTFD